MNFILQHLDTIIIAIVAVILGWDRLRSGTSKLRKEINADYRERNEQLDAQIEALKREYTSQIETLKNQIQKTALEYTGKIAGLEATMIEKDKANAILTEVLQGRNPEIIEILHQITDSNTSIMAFMKEMHTTLIASKNELHYQTGILNKNDTRNSAIDKASSEHEEDPMMAPEKLYV